VRGVARRGNGEARIELAQVGVPGAKPTSARGIRGSVHFHHFNGGQAGLLRYLIHVGRELGFVAHPAPRPRFEFLRRGVALHFDSGFLEGRVLQLALEALAIEMQRHPAAKEFESEVEVPVCYEAEFAPDMDEVIEEDRPGRR